MSDLTLDEAGIVVECQNCHQKNRLRYERLGEPVRCARCKQLIPPPSSPIEVHTAADFDRLIARSSIPIVVDYWAPWCGPCRIVAPEIQKVATRQAGRMLVVKVNVDEVPELGERYRILSIPTMGVFAGGREVTRTAGARPASDIEAFVQQALQTAKTGSAPG
jgi:thioredoxin 2